MKELTIINKNGRLYADSRDVAEMIGKDHAHLLRDIKRYAETIDRSDNPKMDSRVFFIPCTYMVEGNTQIYPRYDITRKGCDMVANKLTGEKGILFTASYVTKFEEMEKSLQHPELQKPMTQAEITAMIAQNQVEIERKAIQALETAQKSMELVGRTGKRLDNALDVLSAPPDKDWRQAMNSKVRGMCMEYGLSYPVFFGDLYKELEDTARVDLDARRNRLRKRLEENGATKTESKAVTKLEVVERDVKLRPIFEGIVRKYQAKYVLDRAPEIEPF